MKCPHCGKRIDTSAVMREKAAEGGKARVAKLTPEQRSAEMRQRAASRWAQWREARENSEEGK